MPAVSVIIPAYNAAGLIEEAIDSVLAQTYKDYEIIVVDDGSTDNTDEVIGSYGQAVTFIKQPNGGAAVARNTGMHNATGKYIAFLDADDIWSSPSKLKIQIALLEEEDDLGMVFCDSFRWKPPAQPSEGELHSILRGRPPQRPSLEFMFKINLVTTSGVIFRRELLDQIGYMDKTLRNGQDFELFIRLASQKTVAYVDDPLVAFRIHSESTSCAITHKNVTSRLKTKSRMRQVALKSVPELKKYLSIRIYALMPSFIQYIMLLWWRTKYGGSIKYLLSCLTRYGSKILPWSH